MSWQDIRFEKLYLEPSRNGVYKSKEHHGVGAKIVNMGELFRYEFIGGQEMARLEMSDQELERSSLRDGDLLFGRRSLIESGAGKCSIARGIVEPTTFESSLIRVRPDPAKVYPTFLYYWLRSPTGRGRIRAIVSGTNVKGIRGSDLKNVLIALPGLNVQVRIASILSAYDDLIENNRRRIALLEEAARQLYKEWFVRFRFPGHERVKIIDGVPEGWEPTRLGNLVSTNSRSYSTRSLPEHLRYIDISAVNKGEITLNSPISSEEAPGRARRIARHGDVIWSNVRPNLRAYALVMNPDEIDVFSTGFTVLSSAVLPFSFLYLHTTTDAFINYLVNHTTGASYPAVRPDDFERAEMIMPPETLLTAFHELCEPNFEMMAALRQQAGELAKARDLLLPKLMSGAIAV